MIDRKTIARIAELLADGFDVQEVETYLNDGEMEARFAEAEDDSDEAIDARYMISEDDEFDTSGVRMRPRINDAGEPWWM